MEFRSGERVHEVIRQMIAEQIASRLHGKRESGGWRCYCPRHNGHSLIISEARDTRKILFKCFGGCSQDDIVDWLKRRGWWNNSGSLDYRYNPLPVADKAPTTDDWVLPIYDKANSPRVRVSDYLAKRGITCSPSVLRFGFVWHKESGARRLPAMVAPIDHVRHGRIGVHATWLGDDDSKADITPNRKFFGHSAGGAVHLAEPVNGQWLIVGEGIENTLSAMMLSGMPMDQLGGWAALSEGGIRSLILPPSYRKIMIAGDNDSHGVGQRAVRAAATRFTAEGRLVKVVIPPNPDTDWNRVLLEKGATV